MLWNATDTAGNFSCHHPSVEGYRYFGVLWGSAVTAVGTVGNALTILALATDARLRTRFNALIANLAAADLLYCAMLQPVSVDAYLHLRWRGGPLWCRIFGLLLFLSNAVSIITLCLIAASRYLLVARRPVFERVFTGRGLVALVLAAWALGVASVGPLWRVFVFAPQVCTCSFHRTRGRPYSTVLLFFYFFVGLGCVGVFYLLIYRRVRVAAKALVRHRFSRRSSRRTPRTPASSGRETEGDSGGDTATRFSCEVSSQEELAQNRGGGDKQVHAGTSQCSCETTLGSARTSLPAKPAGVEEPPPALAPAPPPHPASAPPAAAAAAPPSSDPGEDGEFKRVTRMCFAVFLCFVLCFVPFLLLNMADRRNRAPRPLHMFCANLTWLNSCVNPVLYAAMNRQFGHAYRRLLGKAARPVTCLWAH